MQIFKSGKRSSYSNCSKNTKQFELWQLCRSNSYTWEVVAPPFVVLVMKGNRGKKEIEIGR